MDEINSVIQEETLSALSEFASAISKSDFITPEPLIEALSSAITVSINHSVTAVLKILREHDRELLS